MMEREARERRISARAEEPPTRRCAACRGGAHLRASGGTSAADVAAEWEAGASPRERRNPARDSARHLQSGRISARAEEPLEEPVTVTGLKAHLRASGGTCLIRRRVACLAGASPRERRNPLVMGW